jgi:UDP-4-amino-4,6-dideoxy-N-acetyl-beta-L-altrosamine transaminase
MTRKKIPYGRQNITESDIKAVVETLQSDYLTQGPKVLEFETAFASYIGCKYAVAVANGTAALHLCALALNVKKGDRVIVPPITFAASSNCIQYCDGEVVFSDIDPETYTLDYNKVKSLLQKHPKGYFKGMVPVDFAGYPVDLEKFRGLADEYGMWIIEDACHAPGGYFTDSNGIKQFCGNGNFADLAIFSFHPVKHIACGEGGMITTNNKELYDQLMILRTHGITKDPSRMHENHGGWYMEMQELGYNYRLTDFQAALGTSQLKRADEGMQRRHEIVAKYNQAFKDHPKIKIPFTAKGCFHGHHLYVIQVDKRKELYDYLITQDILAQVHYIPTHLMPYYKNQGWKKGDFPVAEAYYEKCLSIPLYPSLTNEEVEYVIDKILHFLNSN